MKRKWKEERKEGVMLVLIMMRNKYNHNADNNHGR
jgi:hypothetical protein